jgi:4-hydroxyproline epimerase
VLERRGHDAMVGALLCEPADPGCVAGAIFFNNVGMLGMCGRGTMGVAVTLAHLGRIGPGVHRLETPVGVVAFELLDRHTVRIENLPSWRYRKAVSVEVAGLDRVTATSPGAGTGFS